MKVPDGRQAPVYGDEYTVLPVHYKWASVGNHCQDVQLFVEVQVAMLLMKSSVFAMKMYHFFTAYVPGRLYTLTFFNFYTGECEQERF